MNYRIFTDATADLIPELLDGLPDVAILPMEIVFEEQIYTYGPKGTITVEDFYSAQRSGIFASTSQIRSAVYMEQFQQCLDQGVDILYLAFSSGMSGTYQTACLCAEVLQKKYPERKIYCIDTLCASIGEGLLVKKAALLQKEGSSLDELIQWINRFRLNVCHWFTVDTFEHLRRGGRVSKAAAAVGTVLQIKPLLHVSDTGSLEVMKKPRGTRQAMRMQLLHMKNCWLPSLSTDVIVGHGDCPKQALELKELVKAEFPDANIHIAPIGPIIGAHTGPGMLALVFWGIER